MDGTWWDGDLHHGTTLTFESAAIEPRDGRIHGIHLSPLAGAARCYAGPDGRVLTYRLTDGVRLLDATHPTKGPEFPEWLALLDAMLRHGFDEDDVLIWKGMYGDGSDEENEFLALLGADRTPRSGPGVSWRLLFDAHSSPLAFGGRKTTAALRDLGYDGVLTIDPATAFAGDLAERFGRPDRLLFEHLDKRWHHPDSEFPIAVIFDAVHLVPSLALEPDRAARL